MLRLCPKNVCLIPALSGRVAIWQKRSVLPTLHGNKSGVLFGRNLGGTVELCFVPVIGMGLFCFSGHLNRRKDKTQEEIDKFETL